jgi:hypothetical protein
MTERIDSNMPRPFFQAAWPLMLPAVGILAALGALVLSAGPLQSAESSSHAQLTTEIQDKAVPGMSHPACAESREHPGK